MMTLEYNIVVEGLVAKYGDRTVLNGVDMRVRPGEIRVILGGSGSGKSTLMKHVIGLIRPVEGKVELLGCDLSVADEPEKDAVLGRIGMLFQGGALLNSFTILENVALPLKERTNLPEDVVREMARMKLALVDLEQFADMYPPELSGGMKKRAALARALAVDPEVLFCDEPSAGLDPISAAALDRTLLSLRDRFGMSLLVVTHELVSIETIADRVTMIHEGTVLADGAFDEVKASENPRVRAFFDRHADGDEAQFESVYTRLVGDSP